MAEKLGLHVAVGGGDLVCGQRRSCENALQEREGTFQTRAHRSDEHRPIGEIDVCSVIVPACNIDGVIRYGRRGGEE